ncbi:MAG: hypothetical protein MI748_19210, partial [Opitutales bacterium]|nr:hypothetical protein [Opitutales bacterium]
MMRWTVIVLASLSWLFAFHHYTSPALSNGWMASLATLCVTPFVDGQTEANAATFAQMNENERKVAVAVEAAAIGADIAQRVQARVGERFTQWLL